MTHEQVAQLKKMIELIRSGEATNEDRDNALIFVMEAVVDLWYDRESD